MTMMIYASLKIKFNFSSFLINFLLSFPCLGSIIRENVHIRQHPKLAFLISASHFPNEAGKENCFILHQSIYKAPILYFFSFSYLLSSIVALSFSIFTFLR